MAKDIDGYQRSERAAPRRGEYTMDTPPVDGGPRWGCSAVLRPTGPLVDDAVKLGETAAAVAGPGHWVHGPGTLHTTLRAFERHSTRDMTDDPRVAGYVAALTEACHGFGPIDPELRGLVPHRGGVMLLGHCGDDALPRLRRRLLAALADRDIVDHEGDMVRDLWYLNLLHYAAPVADPRALADRGEANADRHVGTARYRAVDIVRWWLVDKRMRPEVLHSVPLD